MCGVYFCSLSLISDLLFILLVQPFNRACDYSEKLHNEAVLRVQLPDET